MTNHGLQEAEPSLQNHCECGAPMVVLLKEGEHGLMVWVPGSGGHDPAREGVEGLAAVLDAHHIALLCGKCDGSEDFDAEYHLELRGDA